MRAYRTTRESGLQPYHSEDQLRLQQPFRVICYNCVRLYLCHDLCSNVGLCRMGISTRAVHYRLSWTWHVHDLSDELVCGMFRQMTKMIGADSLELLVCFIHSYSYEPNIVSVVTPVWGLSSILTCKAGNFTWFSWPCVSQWPLLFSFSIQWVPKCVVFGYPRY